jgi:membrane protease YdiL (CAAX protease family)
MIGFIIVSSEIDNILNYFLPMQEYFRDMFETMMVKQIFIISVILIGIVPAFIEEMLFRGVLLNGFKRNYSEKKAILISAMLFGIIHLNPWQFVTAFIIGVIMAWIYIKTESIILCIYMHFFNNIMSIIVLKYTDVFPIKGFNTAYSERTFQPLWFDLLGIIITAAGILLFIRALKKSENVIY